MSLKQERRRCQVTRIGELVRAERREEIARMLAGATDHRRSARRRRQLLAAERMYRPAARLPSTT